MAAVIAGTIGFAVSPLAAQGIERIDPDQAIDGDLMQGQVEVPAERPGDDYVFATDGTYQAATPVGPEAGAEAGADTNVEAWTGTEAAPSSSEPAASQENAQPAVAAAQGDTYRQDDLIGAAQGLFGEGAEGVARMIEKLLAEQGEPNGYIVGREAGGAFIIGARYGSGTLYHKVEGKMPVYWTGPSIGFDAGANAGNTFVLVYNLYDTDELYERFPAGEGQAYLVGGMTASYLRKGDVVLIPIRVGAGLRLGVNAGYMRFSREQRWLPF
nr:DUF1134 domain-containing protein [Pseudopontixanthobacter vadosimaris]